jgi:hypothetical protein
MLIPVATDLSVSSVNIILDGKISSMNKLLDWILCKSLVLSSSY